MVKEKNPLELFEIAIKKNEITMFLRGEAGYAKFPGPNEYSEPTSFWYVLEHGIYKYYELRNDDVLISKLKNALIEMLHDNLGIYCVIEFLNVYLNHTYSNRAPFIIPLDEILVKFKRILIEKRRELILDKRWSGSQWNVKKGVLEADPLGIWKTILSYGKDFNDKYQINYLPESAWKEIKDNPDWFQLYEPRIKSRTDKGSNPPEADKP